MQFDILYVHPTRRLTDIKYSVMPAGIFGLLDILYNRGFAIGGINVGIELSIDPEYKIEKELAELEYKVILIDLHWYEHAYGAIELARLSKVSHPDVPVVLGGFTATLYADEIMKGHGCVDYILKGDSELPIALLAEYLLRNQEELTRIPNLSYRKDNMVLSNPIEYMCDCIDDINFVPQKYFKNAQYIYFTTPIGINKSTSQYWLEIARGCYYNCSYCCGSSENSEKLFGRKNMIIASPRAVSENIKRLHNLGIKYICVTHDFEMFGKRYYNDLFDLIRNYKIKPGLYHECFQLPNEDFIEQLADTFDLDNLKLAISPLCGNETLRKRNGKKFSNEKLIQILRKALKLGFKIDLYYSINLAYEDGNTFDETISHIKELIFSEVDNPENLYIITRRVVIDPLAPMRKDTSLITKMNNFNDYYTYCKEREDDYIGYEADFDEIRNRLRQYEIFKEDIGKKVSCFIM